METRGQLPVVYSCSGCFSAAQLANHVAVRLDRLGLAEMSCIAGVGGGVPQLVHLAQSGRPVVLLDGCSLACGCACLQQHGVRITRYYQLHQLGVPNRSHEDFEPAQAEEVLRRISQDLAAMSQAKDVEHAGASTRSWVQRGSEGGTPSVPQSTL